MNRPEAVVFDVNETLLDLTALDPLFEELLGRSAARAEWFTRVLQSALITTVLGRYIAFDQLGQAALDHIAKKQGVQLTTADHDAVATALRQLPPHPDALSALGRLQLAGVRIAALTNSPLDMARDQLTSAGLAHLLEQILSVDAVRSLKPAPAVYSAAAQSLDLPPARLWLVSTHDWDVAGALNAGWHGAFVARPGQDYDPLLPPPMIRGADLDEVATALIDRAGDRP